MAWTRETQDGLEIVRLVADPADERHFLTVGDWSDAAVRQGWQDDPQFMEHPLPCLEFCDDITSSEYDVRVVV